MIVYDGFGNGHCNLMLPLAMQDDSVQEAVCIVYALHLGLQDAQMREYAESRRSALIAALTAKVASGNADTVSSLSTGATILVLLIGETVTGSDEFSHLFSLVMAHLETDRGVVHIPTDARDFMVDQTKMRETPKL